VANLGAIDAAAAISAAEKAWPAWRAKTAKERAAILMRWFALLHQHADDLARIMTAEQGKPLAEARGEVVYGASFIEWFAEEARRVYGQTIPTTDNNKRYLVIKQPIGVCAAITPWNFPIAMITRKVAPALAAGCPVVIKPAEQTPLSALAVAELAQRAGMPAGVLNVLCADAASSIEIGNVLCSSDVVRHLSFTGSTEVGRILARQCAPSIKKLSLELGGNAPFIVFDDADIDSAVEGAMVSKYRNAGQTCVCANRFYVQAGVYDTFVEKLAAKAAGIKVGNGFEAGVNQGPLIDDAAINKVEGHVADALAKGARVVVGGSRSGERFYTPTVLADVSATCCAPRKRPSARWHRCSASRPRPKPSPWPTPPSLAWPATSTAATSGACSASARRWNTAWWASTPGSSAPPRCPLAASSKVAWGAKARSRAWTTTWRIKYLCLGDILR
jgi:succinate-semialdehyde dehydrogenase/glutarate-semialdehyde dehydrogenase